MADASAEETKAREIADAQAKEAADRKAAEEKARQEVEALKSAQVMYSLPFMVKGDAYLE